MTREVQAPTVEQVKERGESHQVLKHPAFATLSLTHLQGGPKVLFGSDVGALGCVRFELRRAELHRDLSHDWVSQFGHDVVAVWEMTHAQFAEFITSAGRAGGVPVTLTRAPKTPAVGLPEIQPLESKQDLFKREIREAAAKRIEHMEEQVKRLSELIESGKIGKKDLREIARNLSVELGNLPGNLEFVVESAEEALETATAAARLQIDAHVTATARALGVQSLQALSQATAPAGALPSSEDSDTSST